MGDLDFGYNISSIEEVCNFIIKLNKHGRVDAKMYLMAYYDSEYSIYDHFKQTIKRPLALVAMHPAEDPTTDTLLEAKLLGYAQSGIKDVFGLNVKEFMSLPMDICDMMHKVANNEIAKKNKATSDVLKDISK